MDEPGVNLENTQPEPENRNPDVGFPIPQEPQKSKFPLWVIVLIIILLIAGGGIYLFTKKSNEETNPLPSPETSDNSTEPTSEPSASPIAIDKTKIKIEVQNGTGISGEAAYLQGLLRNLGYSDIVVANSSVQNNASVVVTFKSDLSSEVVNEVSSKLEEIYQNTTKKTSSSSLKDVVIITGLRKGQTPKPSSTPRPSPSVSPVPTSSSSPTISPSPSPTP